MLLPATGFHLQVKRLGFELQPELESPSASLELEEHRETSRCTPDSPQRGQRILLSRFITPWITSNW